MPSRIIKESICYSDDLDKLSAFEETVFYRLIVNCDDYGRIDARANFLKSKLFVTKQGITEKNISDAVSKLASVGLINLYQVDGKPFLLFPKWSLHQRVRDSKEKYPAPQQKDSRGEFTQDAAECSSHVQACAGAESNPIQSESNPNPNPEESAPAQRHKHGKYGWVLLTDEEYSKLQDDLGQSELNRCVEYVDELSQSSGNKNKWKDWNLVIRKCSRDKWGIKQGSKKPVYGSPPKTPTENTQDYERMKKELDRMRSED